MLDDGVLPDIAFDFVAVTFDQSSIILERFDQLQDATYIFMGCFAQAFELFIYHHGADAVMGVNLQ